MTERLVGHCIGDFEQYRKPGELDAAGAIEPIVRLCGSLGAQDVSETELDGVVWAAQTEIGQPVEPALAAPQPARQAFRSTCMPRLNYAGAVNAALAQLLASP